MDHGIFAYTFHLQVSVTAGVPTVWLGLLQHVDRHNLSFRWLKTVVIGGSAAPRSMIETFEHKCVGRQS